MINKTTIWQKNVWLASIVTTCLYIFFKYNGNYNLASILSIILLVLVMFTNLENNVYMLFFFAPLYLYIFIGGSQFFNFVVFLLIFKRMLLKRERIPRRALLISLGLFCYELTAVIINNGTFTLYFVKWIIAVFLAFWLLEKPIKNYKHFRAIFALNIGTAIIGVSTIIQYGTVKVDSTIRDQLQGGLSTLDQNTFSLYCLVASVAAISVFLDKSNDYKDSRTTFNKILLAIFAGVNFVSGMYMISKTFFLISGIMLIIILLNELYSLTRFIKTLLIFSVGFFILYQIPQVIDLVNSFIGRLNEASNFNELTTGRQAIINYYISYLYNHPIILFIGTGLFTYPSAMGLNQVTHNMTLEIICAWGIFGLLLVLYLFYICYHKLKSVPKQNKTKLFNIPKFYPLIVFLIFAQSLALFVENVTLIYIVFIIYHASFHNESI
jgi:hypothetical protein